MADKIIIEGVLRCDGEYEFDLVDQPLTTLEWRWIKKLSGYLPMTVNVGWVGEDPDLFLALAVISMVRAGKISRDEIVRVAAELEEAPTSAISVVGEKVADADDQAEAPELTSESNGTSGVPSSQTSDLQGQTPSPTGSQDSERSAISDLPTLVI